MRFEQLSFVGILAPLVAAAALAFAVEARADPFDEAIWDPRIVVESTTPKEATGSAPEGANERRARSGSMRVPAGAPPGSPSSAGVVTVNSLHDAMRQLMEWLIAALG